MNKIKELDIVSKYLDEDELKEVAKSAAYDLFKSSIAPSNSHQKDNIDFWCSKGAMLAMAEQIEPIKDELQDEFNKKVKSCIKSLSLYNIIGSKIYNLDSMINSSLEIHKKEINERVTKIIKKSYLAPETEYNDKLYNKVYEVVGEMATEILNDALEQKFKEIK